MADIVIRGLDMPRPIAGEAGYVDFRIFSDGTAIMASAKPPYYKQFETVALPEGHGRLVDADALWEKMYHLDNNEGAHKDSAVDDSLILRDSACYLIENAPTIIEADLEWKMKNCCCFSNTDPAKGGGEDADK